MRAIQRLREEDFLCDPECERECDLRDDLLRVEWPELREELLRRLDDDLRGTLAPPPRASESPMAMACLRLVTFLPLRPLFNVPCFLSCIARFTLLCAFAPYFLPPEDWCDRLVAMDILPSSDWEADADEEVARRGSGQAAFQDGGRASAKRAAGLIRGRGGRKNVFDIDPLCGVVAGVAGDAEGVAFASVAGLQ